MNFNNTWNNNNGNSNGNEPAAIADAPEAAGVEIVANEEPTLFAPTASADAAESGSGGLWLQNVFGGGVELSMSMRNDENEEESSAASTRPLGSASSFIAKNKKIILFALTGLFVFAVAIGASQVAKNKRMISSAAVSAAKAPKFSKEPKIGSKAPKVTKAPKTAVPSMMPSDTPSTYPSDLPSDTPSLMPSGSPSVSVSPSEAPSAQPSVIPSSFPSLEPSSTPSSMPSESPSDVPSSMPSETPSSMPSEYPSGVPSSMPSEPPSDVPSSMPSSSPSLQPSSSPSASPSEVPSAQPSTIPSASPSLQPSSSPSKLPTTIPSASPSLQPSSAPSFSPSISEVPSENPSKGCTSDTTNGEFNSSVAVLPDGRLDRGGDRSTCSNVKAYPNITTNNCNNGCRYLTFGPFSDSTSGCLEIVLDNDSCLRNNGGSFVFLAAYSQPFDETDLSAGYLGDMRDIFKSSFQIPYTAGNDIYIMAQADHNSPSPCDFSFDLVWSDGSVNGAFSGSDPDLPNGRLVRGTPISNCTIPKPFPGVTACNTNGGCQYKTFGPFSRGGSGCLEIVLDKGTCTNPNNSNLSTVFLSAYKDTFNASDLQVGYLGDVSNFNRKSFKVGYEAGDEIYIMAQARFSVSSCEFSFELLWGVCE